MSITPDKLRKRIDARREERERLASYQKELRDRQRVIREAYEYTPMGFWCDECRKDFEAMGYKQIAAHNREWPRAYYVGICPKGHRAIRRITDKEGDGYYYKSELIRRQRIDLADAMLQPHDPRFRSVYPEAWKKIEAEREAHEQARREAEAALRL